MEDPEASGGREAVPEENAAVLEKLEKNGAFATRAGGAQNFYLEAEEIADNFTEGDKFPEENAAVLERLEKNGAKFFI